MLIVFISLMATGACMRSAPLLELTVEETAGVERTLEYVEVVVPWEKGAESPGGFSLRARGTDRLVGGQVIDSLCEAGRTCFYRVLFPVSSAAYGKTSYELMPGGASLQGEALRVTGEGMNLLVENTHFIADLTDRKASPENGLGDGQISGLTLKAFDNQLLERSHINMHWAPNFQKDGPEYKTFGHMLDPDSVRITSGPYLSTVYRSGYVEGFEEILVSCEYRFYAGLPYFIFSSEIQVEQEVELFLLRNDEMTMDSLFTHLLYPGKEGEVVQVELYSGPGLDELDNDPIPDDAPWLSFIHQGAQFGFASIRLEYDNTRADGTPSVVFKPHTKISKSAGNGRYWNRRLVHDHLTLIPLGSRYREKNAYLVFTAHPDQPWGELVAVQQQLSSPLEVSY